MHDAQRAQHWPMYGLQGGWTQLRAKEEAWEKKKEELMSFVSLCDSDIASGLIYKIDFQNPAEVP